MTQIQTAKTSIIISNEKDITTQKETIIEIPSKSSIIINSDKIIQKESAIKTAIKTSITIDNSHDETIPKETTIEMLEKTSIYIDSYKMPFFEIYILQVQIINKLLMIFLTASIKLEKGFHFKFSIELYKKNKMRNFENSLYINKEIDFYLSLKDFESGEVITLTSQEEFDEEDRVVIKEISNDEYEMKVLNNDNKILDTQENKKMIENNEIIDFSNSSYNYDINKYYIESSSKGCQFNLKSKINISENYQNIILNFFEKNKKKII